MWAMTKSWEKAPGLLKTFSILTLKPSPNHKLQQWGLSEEVPRLSITVCKTQRACLSRRLLKFFFPEIPLPALGEAVSNSRWGPEAGCTAGSWVCPSTRPLTLSSPSSNTGPFLRHTPTGPSWVVRPAKDTNQTWGPSNALYVSDRCLFFGAWQRLTMCTSKHIQWSRTNRMLCNVATDTSVISVVLCFLRPRGRGCRESLTLWENHPSG